MNSAELDVKQLGAGVQEAPVIMKPARAVIFTEPSVWVDASFVIVNEKKVLPPVEVGGETVTTKHLPDEGQVDDCPAAGAANIAAPSMLAVITKKETRATMKP